MPCGKGVSVIEGLRLRAVHVKYLLKRVVDRKREVSKPSVEPKES